MGWGVGWGSIPIHHHMTAVVGVPLPPWPEQIRYLALLSMMPSIHHSLADLDFRDQLARRLFCVRYVQRPFLSRSRPLWPIARRNSPLSSGPSLPLALLLQGCSLFLNHGQETRAERLPGMNDASGLT